MIVLQKGACTILIHILLLSSPFLFLNDAMVLILCTHLPNTVQCSLAVVVIINS